MSNHDQHGQHRYGSVHKKVRGHFLLRMEQGEVFACWRCGNPIKGPAWDLGHVDGGQGVAGRWPEHRRCNRATLTHIAAKYGGLGAARANGAGPVVRREPFAKKAKEDRFGGLPDPTPDNVVDTWSRHWGPQGGFDPRCPDCRERGSECDAVIEARADGPEAA